MNKKLKIFVVLITLMCLLLCYYHHKMDTIEEQPFVINKGLECGIVITTYSETYKVKHGYNDRFFIKVKYSDRTEVTETRIDAREGETICFTKKKVNFFFAVIIIVAWIYLIVLSCSLVLWYVIIPFFQWLYKKPNS